MPGCDWLLGRISRGKPDGCQGVVVVVGGQCSVPGSAAVAGGVEPPACSREEPESALMCLGGEGGGGIPPPALQPQKQRPQECGPPLPEPGPWGTFQGRAGAQRSLGRWTVSWQGFQAGLLSSWVGGWEASVWRWQQVTGGHGSSKPGDFPLPPTHLCCSHPPTSPPCVAFASGLYNVSSLVSPLVLG